MQTLLPNHIPYQRSRLTRSSPQAQTPQQRAANARYARREESKMGKPLDDRVKRTTKQDFKSPISKGWISASLFFTFPFPSFPLSLFLSFFLVFAKNPALHLHFFCLPGF